MSTKDWPALLAAASFEWGIQKSALQFASPHNGTPQSIDFVAERWVVAVTLPARLRADAGGVEAFFNWLAGGVNRTRLWHMGSGSKRQPGAPRGTLRGTPTLSSAHARGDASLLITTTPGATVQAGDMLGCSGHLLQAAEDALANGAGALTVPLVNRVRGPIASAAAVVWSRPTADFILPATSVRHAHVPRFLEAGTFDLIEVW